jgi:hypothetical protein
MRWKMMKMKRMSLQVNSKWYEDLGKSLGLPNKLSDLPSVKYLPKTQDNQVYYAI